MKRGGSAARPHSKSENLSGSKSELFVLVVDREKMVRQIMEAIGSIGLKLEGT